jgi:hypothetical protein
MTWLAAQVWPYLLLSALAGTFLTVVMSIRTTKVERAVEVPVEVPALVPAAQSDEVERTSATDGPEKPYPFPEYRGEPAARPWEAEELWSQPVRTGPAPDAPVKEAADPDADEWEVAAGSWRDWAAAARAGSSAPAATPPSPEGPDDLPQLPGSTFPVLPPDDFPYAEPVEADRS